MTEVNGMGLEDAWHEVGKKKVTPKKEPLNNKTISKSKSLRSKSSSESSSRRNIKDPSGKSKPSDLVKVNGKISAKKGALKSSPSGTASSQPQVVTSSSNEHISIDSTQLDFKDASSHVIEGSGKKGYSSIVAALAERLPPDPLPVISPISIYEFCMQCHDPAHWETPTLIPSTKPRGLINSKSDCFQNCILQALFALPTIRHLVFSFQSQPNLHEHLPLWSEFLSFGRRFLENESETHHADVIPPTYQARAHHRGGAHATASRTIPAQYKDSLLASSYMPRLSSLFARAEAAEGDAIADITSEVSIMNIGSKYAAQVNKSNNSNNSQQDAMEFLTFFFDALHEEVRQAWITSTSDEEQSIFDHWIRSLPYMQVMEQQLHGASSVRADSSSSSSSTTWSVVQKPSRQQPVIPKSKIIQVDDASKQQAIREYASSSIIPRLFHGWLRSEVTYKAQRSCSITFQKFHCLTLSMQRDMATTASTGKPAVPMTMTLQSCLQNYFADEVNFCSSFDCISPLGFD